MIRCVVFFALAIAASAVAETSKPDIHKSLVRITTTSQDPDYRVPWNPGNITVGIGAGFVIDGNRILTNAHVVSNGRLIVIEKENDPKEYIGQVEFIGSDCDLAVVKVQDSTFYKGTAPVHFGGLPAVQSIVDVFGYPIGGTRLSVTHGIVSRVDFQNYTYSGVDQHLAVQIDAAINPGNSGGPVLQDGKVVGVAFQGYTGDVAQNTGYMIPTPVIQRFLRDISTGRYNRYVDLSIQYFKLLNGAERHALGLPDDNTGVVVSSVEKDGSCAGKLQEGDVMLSIDNHPIASDGNVRLDGDNLDLAEVVERKFKGDKVKIGILRNRQPLTVEVDLEPNNSYLLQANLHEENPRFVLFGGLVFQPLSRNFMEAYQPDELRVRYYYGFYVTDELYEEHPEVVVLSNILADPVNAYLSEFRFQIVDEINGQKIKHLSDVAHAFATSADQYVVKFLGSSRPAVLEKRAVEAAQQRIKRNYNVSIEQNLGKERL
ncbi:MAG TPA: trypsin-like peptidase domain-containing protein [Chthoniobacterales bacterium]|jgi:S1-C subfamily serine protease|nr:trypsin-like peptidase domain-containing protein [Chthoniobacterales bacterium]